MKRVRSILILSGLAIVLVGVAGLAIFAYTLWPGPGKVERAMIRQIIHSRSNPAGIQIKIKSATDFDWDKMYAFRSAPEKGVEEVTGTQVLEDCDISPALFFLQNGRIVYQECEPSDFEGVTEDDVIFDIPDDANYKSYLPNAVFSATVAESKEGPYYVLKQIQ
jgi:hypothetical protein